MSAPVIAIDGPSASGKGTVARRVAAALGFHCLESGALYRLIALASLRGEIDPADEAALAACAGGLDVSFREDGIYLSGQRVTDALQTEECGARASRIAPLPRVRAALLSRQRAFRRPPGLVADGRDMGTIVFPDAGLKVFLGAAPEVRAQRRYNQLKEKGLHANLRALSRELAARDARDAGRAVAPLAAAVDAVEVDSSGLSIEAVVGRIIGLWKTREQGGSG
ncbi:MAG: (d)CMP kinase [Proteobacteria bacterium]|nr:(d)CMP kinase [Pseudomonadota bacterium]